MLDVKIDSACKDQILKSVEGHIAARQLKKAKQCETHELSFDRDETFAYIAGYTEAGFAFGVTWEEWEQLNQRHLPDLEPIQNTSLNDDPPELPF
jgi:hypothetical protein